jgi:hypothetical protein
MQKNVFFDVEHESAVRFAFGRFLEFLGIFFDLKNGGNSNLKNS